MYIKWYTDNKSLHENFISVLFPMLTMNINITVF